MPKKPEVIVVTLSNNDSAMFVNGDAVYQLDASDLGEIPLTVGNSLADALGIELKSYQMDVPSDPEWSWNDVYELLPPADPVEPELKWFAVTGRIPGDDEDACHIFNVGTRGEALAAFEEAMWEDEPDAESARESLRKEHGQTVFWNSIVCSDTPITEA